MIAAKEKTSLMGFPMDAATRRLILAYLVMSVLTLISGAIAALYVVLTRAPAIQLLNPYAYYMALTFHGMLMLTMFPHLFEIGLAYYTVAMCLKQKVASVYLGWIGWLITLAGIGIILATVASGQASVMYTLYVPLRANGWLYVGHVIYAVGILIAVANFFFSVILAKNHPQTAGRSLPLATYGMAIALILLAVSFTSALVAFVPATLWAFRFPVIPSVDPLVFKAAFWGMGHTLQYTNVASMAVGWYVILAFAHHADPTEKLSRWAFALYLLTTVPVLGHHLIVDPTWSPTFKYFGATLVGALLGIPSIMHGMAIPASAEKTLRKRQGPYSLMGFFKDWGWGMPSMVLLAFSWLLFGFGGFDGTAATTVQLNMVLHNTFWMPAHIHGTLAGGAAVAFMGVAYYLLPELGIDIKGKGLARLQAWLQGLGFLWMVVVMHQAAGLGVPRRAQDIHYTAMAAQGVPIPNWFTTMNVLAIGGVVAATAILIFGGIILASLLAPRRVRLAEGTGYWGQESWAKGKRKPPLAATGRAGR